MIEIVLLLLEQREVHLLRIFLLGGYGPGSYYVPVMMQLLIIFPIIYLLIEKNATLGLTAAAIANLLFEAAIKLFEIDKYYYRLSIGRYLLLIAFGCYLYLYPDRRMKRYQMLLMFFAGLSYLIAVFGFDQELLLFEYWKTTAMPVAFYIFPIVILLFRRFYHSRIPGTLGKLLRWMGQASYHIFLAQMVYYHFKLGGPIMEAAWYVAVPFNILISVPAGLAFYELDRLCMGKIKQVKRREKVIV